jgi:transposase
MALGRRKREQQEAWVATSDLPKSPGHPFYEKLNGLLAEAGFDAYVEELCRPYYAEGRGRPSIPPGMYFRMLLAGYFEGIGTQRGIAWRCSDSLSLRAFLGLGATQAAPDHSSLTVIRQRLPWEVYMQVFLFVLALAQVKGLLDGKSLGVDATTLEANAAMKAIVRRDTGEDWQAYLTQLMREEGVVEAEEEPTEEARRRFDQKRKKKKVSNEEWVSPTDPESRITKMKDGTTRLAYKAEHAVDLKSNFIVAATVHGGDRADVETLPETLVTAQANLIYAGSPAVVQEVVADKGYHKAEGLAQCAGWQVRTYVSERRTRKRRRWKDKPPEWKEAVQGNRRRIRGARGRRLRRQLREKLERSFAHVCETGGGRRAWLRGLLKVAKHYLMQALGHNVGLLMRKLFGIGTPRSLQGLRALLRFLQLLVMAVSHGCRSLPAASATPLPPALRPLVTTRYYPAAA